MNSFVFLLFLFLCVFITSYVESTFPKCEDILSSESGGMPPCIFCETDRIKEKCAELCESSGCNKLHSKSEDNSRSKTTSEQNGSETKSASDNKENESSSSATVGSGKSAKHKKKGEAKKAKGKKKQESAAQVEKSSSNKKQSSSSSNHESSSSSSNQGASSSSKKETSSSSNQGSSSASNQASSSSGSSSSNSASGNSNTKVSSTCNDIDPCVPMEEANKGYKERCKATGLSAGCVAMCRYDAPFSELKKGFLHHECEIADARDLLYSAANRKNNVKCCQAKGVLDGNRAGICDCFCNPGCDEWTGKAEAKYLRCLSQFDNIMACHWASCRH